MKPGAIFSSRSACWRLFCVLVLLLVYFTLGRPLALLQKMTAAFRQIGRGDYSPRIEERGAPEIVDLSHCFNEMVARLDDTEQQNVKLQQQLTNVQEEERADLARDLHDEIGPLLFALNIDISTLQRRGAEGRKQASADLDAIASAVSEIQRSRPFHAGQVASRSPARSWA